MNDLSASGHFHPKHDLDQPIYLVDLDGVVFDMELPMYEIFHALYPDRQLPPREERKSFYVTDEVEDKMWHRDIHEIICQPNFFRDLPLIEGAVEAIKEMNTFGTVIFCTSPMVSNPYCSHEKFLAIEQHFGEEMVYRTIITKDKTAARGNMLFDDRPEVEGIFVPTWRHAVFGQPYNAHLVDALRCEGWEEGVEIARQYAAYYASNPYERPASNWS